MDGGRSAALFISIPELVERLVDLFDFAAEVFSLRRLRESRDVALEFVLHCSSPRHRGA